ncbi:MAG TPA: BTAD domain-containing putative transcriptional regulator, partial [Gemmatimonadales bacterium]
MATRVMGNQATVTMFRLRVLGGMALEGPGGAPVSALPHRRALAVLAVLAVSGNIGCSRERLLALLWPESDEAHARHGLRDALHALRQALSPDSIPSTGSLLRLDATAVGSDVLAFSMAVASGRLADAVRAYGGPLLDGFHLDEAPEFEHWLAAERTRLERECVEALEELAGAAEAAGSWAEAARWWARAVEHDPLNSHFVLRQMQAMAAIGDRANALQAWELHTRRLREEYGLEPDPAVFPRIEEIRRGSRLAPQGIEA